MVPCRSAEPDILYERFVTFSFAFKLRNLGYTERDVTGALRGRLYCARRPLACYVHDTRFARAVRVAYFGVGSEGLNAW